MLHFQEVITSTGIRDFGKINKAIKEWFKQGAIITIQVDALKESKTYEQIKAFYGPVVNQVIQIEEQFNGIRYPEDEMKWRLKLMFLKPIKRFHSNGKPVMSFFRDDATGEQVIYQEQDIQSLGDMTLVQMNSFITQIIDYYWHKFGASIVIEKPEEKDQRIDKNLES